MGFKNTTERYGSLSVAMHWLMLLLLIAVYASIELRGFFPKGSDPRNLLKVWHFMLGLSVLGLVALRLVIVASGVTPRIVPNPPRWQTISAHILHGALYLLMIGMPIAGWLILSAEGKPIPFFGLHLPALIGEDKSLAKLIEGIHVTIGNLGYVLIGLHALAALIHHYAMGDNTLRRMLPKRN